MTDNLATVTRAENTASGRCCARRRAPRHWPTTDRRTLVLGLVGPIGVEGVSGLAYDISSDVLYGGGTRSANGSLSAIDRLSGAGSLVGVGPEGTSSLEYLPTRDQLLFTTNALELFGEINKTTGAQTIIGPMEAGLLFGMGYDTGTSTLYALAGDSRNVLYEIGPLTGVATELATLSRTEYFASMAVVPEPEMVLLLSVGMVLVTLVAHRHLRSGRTVAVAR